MSTIPERAPQIEELSCIGWLDALAPTEGAWATASLRVRVARPGDVVCRVGEMPTHWIGVINGQIKKCGNHEDGRAVTFAALPSGGWFGEVTILKGRPTSTTFRFSNRQSRLGFS